MSDDLPIVMKPEQWLDALAHAWDAGFDASAERAQRAILLAATMGTPAAVKQMKDERPVVNPYRVKRGG